MVIGDRLSMCPLVAVVSRRRTHTIIVILVIAPVVVIILVFRSDYSCYIGYRFPNSFD